MIVAVISIGRRQSHADRPVLKPESPLVNQSKQSVRSRHATGHTINTILCTRTHTHNWTCAQRSSVRLVRVQG